MQGAFISTIAKTVFLVGAGPGDPGLITVKGKDCLKQADVVIYDSLANPILLDYAPESAELIYVGKQGANHTMKQEDINQLISHKAREGKTVVRLKGGDPLIFGRGAEEALALLEAGVPFEIVPGITSGIAAPTYAGIPPTYRALNSVLTFVTGHEDPTKDESAIDWKALAASGTLVFYMGMKNLPVITSKLIQAGKDPKTPVAVIHKGTLPGQRVVTGTLQNIADNVTAACLKPPCIILVGEVTELRPKLCWFEDKPLFGKRIIVTRSRTQASDLVTRLRELGADVIPFPTISIEPPENAKPLADAIKQLESFDWIVFTSSNTVDSVFEQLKVSGKDSRALSHCKVCAIGSATCERLAANGIVPDLMPERQISQALFETMKAQDLIKGKRFLLPRADIAPQDFPKSLAAEGAEVVQVEAYRTVPAKPNPVAMQAIRDASADIVTFTSSSTANNFASLVRTEFNELPDGITYVSIGPETTKAATSEGMNIAIEAQQHDINGLVDAIIQNFGK